MKIINYDDIKNELGFISDSKEPLIISDMPNDVYHASVGISNTGLGLIDRSPAHYAFNDHESDPRHLAIGRAIHSAVLELDYFKSDYILLEDVNDRRASEYKQAAKVYGADFVLTSKDARMVRGIQDRINMNDEAKQILKTGIAELSFFARDPETGVLCKIRFDWLNDAYALDLKTTQDIRDFAKSCAYYRYHVQQAFYSSVFKWATGNELQSFNFLAVEKTSPYANKLFQLDDPSVDYGYKLMRENLNTYADCLAKDNWPTLDSSLEIIALPEWAQDEELREF